MQIVDEMLASVSSQNCGNINTRYSMNSCCPQQKTKEPGWGKEVKQWKKKKEKKSYIIIWSTGDTSQARFTLDFNCARDNKNLRFREKNTLEYCTRNN